MRPTPFGRAKVCRAICDAISLDEGVDRATGPAVAIRERVDGLELRMSDRDLSA